MPLLSPMMMYGGPRNPWDEDPTQPIDPALLEQAMQARVQGALPQRWGPAGGQVGPLGQDQIAQAVAQLRTRDAMRIDPQADRWATMLANPAQAPVDEFADTPDDVARKAAMAAAPVKVKTPAVQQTPEQLQYRDDRVAANERKNLRGSAQIAQRRGVLRPSAQFALEDQGVLSAPDLGGAGGAGKNQAAFIAQARRGAFAGMPPDQLFDAYQTAMKLDANDRLASAARGTQTEQFNQEMAFKNKGLEQSGAAAKEQAALKAREIAVQEQVARQAMQAKAMESGLPMPADAPVPGAAPAPPTSAAANSIRQLPKGAPLDSIASLIGGPSDFSPEDMAGIQQALIARGITPDQMSGLAQSTARAPGIAGIVPPPIMDAMAKYGHVGGALTLPYWLAGLFGREDPAATQRRQTLNRAGTRFGLGR